MDDSSLREVFPGKLHTLAKQRHMQVGAEVGKGTLIGLFHYSILEIFSTMLN